MVTCSIAQNTQLVSTDKDPAQKTEHKSNLTTKHIYSVLDHDQEDRRKDRKLKSKSSSDINTLAKEEYHNETKNRRTVTPKPRLSFESELTFTPKLNSLSLKLVKSKASVAEKLRQGYECRIQVVAEELDQEFTFKPTINTQSSKIAGRLNSTFWGRQEQHLSKQRQLQEKSLDKVNANIESSCKKEVVSEVTPDDDKEDNILAVEDMPKPAQAVKPAAKSKKKKRKDVEEIHPLKVKNDNCYPLLKERRSLPASLRFGYEKDEGIKRKKLSKVYNKCTLPSENATEKTTKSLECPMSNKDPNAQQQAQQHTCILSNEIKYSSQSLKLNCSEDRKRAKEFYQGVTSSNEDDKGHERGNKAQRVRTQTYPSQVMPLRNQELSPELFLQAKRASDKAMREKKVFLCIGPYHVLRQCMRKRGWVEKYFKADIAYRSAAISKRLETDSGQSDDDIQDGMEEVDEVKADCKSPESQSVDNCSEPKQSCQENQETDKETDISTDDTIDSTNDAKCDNRELNIENDDLPCINEELTCGNTNAQLGKMKSSLYEKARNIDDFQYWIMSRIVRNCIPTFIWTCKRDDIDFKYLQKDQIVNHYIKAGSFTTKAGLCVNLRNLPWFEHQSPDYFFPRCHRLSSDSEKLNFIDDFRITAALCILKIVVYRHDPNDEIQTVNSVEQKQSSNEQNLPRKRSLSTKPENISVIVPSKAIALAKRACINLIKCKEHADIEESFLDESSILPQTAWDELLDYYYKIVHNGGIIAHASSYFHECNVLLDKMRDLFPQIDVDGVRNIWIIKPGAKSRGRGIVIMNKLYDILQLVSNNVSKRENRLVVQKYIERPLLIHNTKFDIRQWYLVTDWNPLTIWFYQKCYLRFCGQEFTFDKFDPQYHLANNSIQKNYKNGQRSHLLPQNNMWTCDQFKEYLKSQRKAKVWHDLIYPSMKKAIIYALECCQDDLEYRKNSFELYGADFMLGEDYHPWLIEINCSPAMGASTVVTERLCAQVIDDMLKVVIDRRENKNCDTGYFELVHKQPYIAVPPYIGSSLAVEGEAVKKPAILTRQNSTGRLARLARFKETKPMTEEQDTASTQEKNKGETKIIEFAEKVKCHANISGLITDGSLTKNSLARIETCRISPRTAPEPVKLILNKAECISKGSSERMAIEYRLNSRYRMSDQGNSNQTAKILPTKGISSCRLSTSSLEFSLTSKRKSSLALAGPKDTCSIPERLTRQALKACRNTKRHNHASKAVPMIANGPKALTSISIRPGNNIA